MTKKKKIFSKTSLLILGAVILAVIGVISMEVFDEVEKMGCGIVADVEGNRYRTTEIGGQCWFAENLATKTYRNGERVPEAETHRHADRDWDTGKPAYTWYNHGDFWGKEREYVDKHGYLYNFYAVSYYREKQDSGYRLCPEGWRVPTHDDWRELERFICNNQGNENCEEYFSRSSQETGFFGTNEGNKLRSKDFIGPFEGRSAMGTNDYLFNAMSGGQRYDSGSFGRLDYSASWWSSTEENDRAWVREIYYTEPNIGSFLVEKSRGHNIRCVQQ